MASAMGLFDWFRSTPDKTAVAELADLAGRKETLMGRLRRHAAMCSYPTIKAGLERLAEEQAESFEVLRAILADRNTWPRPIEETPREGSNNWERLSGDLEILHALALGIQKAAGIWEGIDAAVAAKLMPIAVADGEAEARLRALALKCDPQALD